MDAGGKLRAEDLEVSGPLDRRLEVAISLPMDAVLVAMAERMAGGNPRMARSKAARRLIAAGAATVPGLLAEAGRVAVRLERERTEREAASRG